MNGLKYAALCQEDHKTLGNRRITLALTEKQYETLRAMAMQPGNSGGAAL